MTADLSALIARLEAGERGNALDVLDVLVEIAPFEPDQEYASCRSNNAGTKAVYTAHNGLPATFLARDWTAAESRADVIALLRAKQGEGE